MILGEQFFYSTSMIIASVIKNATNRLFRFIETSPSDVQATRPTTVLSLLYVTSQLQICTDLMQWDAKSLRLGNCARTGDNAHISDSPAHPYRLAIFNSMYVSLSFLLCS